MFVFTAVALPMTLMVTAGSSRHTGSLLSTEAFSCSLCEFHQHRIYLGTKVMGCSLLSTLVRHTAFLEKKLKK